MSELEQALNDLNKNGEMISEAEIDEEDLDIIKFRKETVEEDEELNRFESCIYTKVSELDCDPINLHCNMSCNYTSNCIFNPYSEFYNMSMEEFKECIKEQSLFNEMIDKFYNSPEGQCMLKELQESLIAIVEDYIEKSK